MAGRRLRLGVALDRSLWCIWPRIALRIGDQERRENFLAVYAPFMMILLLASWVIVLALGFGCILWALRAELRPQPITFFDALYFAGTSVLTLGYGDIVATRGLPRLIALCSAASGLGVLSLTTAYLFAVFGSFQRRESYVVQIGSRAGVPPSGVALLTMHAETGLRDDLAQVFRDGQRWATEVMESHLAYPILMHFRSSHDYESWLGTLGTLLDASVLAISVLDGTRQDQRAVGQARIMFDIGEHATHDLAHYIGIEVEDAVGIERGEFDRAYESLGALGYSLRAREEAWQHFSQRRRTYAARLNAMARWFEIPPIQWVGDRSFITTGHQHGSSR